MNISMRWDDVFEPVFLIMTVTQFLVAAPLLLYTVYVLYGRHKNGTAGSWQFLAPAIIAVIMVPFVCLMLYVFLFDFPQGIL